jgi:hypothetical protein
VEHAISTKPDTPLTLNIRFSFLIGYNSPNITDRINPVTHNYEIFIWRCVPFVTDDFVVKEGFFNITIPEAGLWFININMIEEGKGVSSMVIVSISG